MGIMQSERKLADLHCVMETFRAFFMRIYRKTAAMVKLLFPKKFTGQ